MLTIRLCIMRPRKEYFSVCLGHGKPIPHLSYLRLPRPASFRHNYETYSVEEVFALLQRATVEGNEHDRAFALLLLGALATPKALDIVRSFSCRRRSKSAGPAPLHWVGTKKSAFFPSCKLFCWMVFS